MSKRLIFVLLLTLSLPATAQTALTTADEQTEPPIGVNDQGAESNSGPLADPRLAHLSAGPAPNGPGIEPVAGEFVAQIQELDAPDQEYLKAVTAGPLPNGPEIQPQGSAN
jgi:hypothetical protein